MSEADEMQMFPPRVGDTLRAAREAMGLSLDEIAGRTRVPSRHLATIESGDLGRLPAAPYSAGFIKSYARVVGLDEAELSRAFRDELAAHGDVHAASMPFAPADPSRVAPRALAWTAAAIALLMVIGYAVWRNAIGDDADTRAQLAAQTEPPPPAPAASIGPGTDASPPVMAAPTAAPAATPAGPVALTALQPVWIRVYDRDGDKTLFMGELAQGQRYEVPAGVADPLVRTGRSESLRVTVGAAEAPPLGPPATILRDVSLRPDALFGRKPAVAAAPPPAAAAQRPRRRPDQNDAYRPDADPAASAAENAAEASAPTVTTTPAKPVLAPPNNHP